MSSPEKIQTFLSTWHDAWSRQDFEGVLALFANEFVFEDIPIGLHATNKTEMREVLETTFEGVPNFKMDVFDHQLGHGFVVTKWTQTGNVTVKCYGLDLKDHAYEVVTTYIIGLSPEGLVTSVSDNWNTGVFYQ
ncbi:MAG: nuclear transport factor 2 family protein [Pseudomonadota bacterium]